MEYETNPVKAIRKKCLDCCCGSTEEVKSCEITDCWLHPFRLGKNPFRAKREMTDEQREALATRLLESRKNREENQRSVQ